MSRAHVREDQQSCPKYQSDREVTGSCSNCSCSSCDTHNQQKKINEKNSWNSVGCYYLQMNYPSPKERRVERAHCDAEMISESFLGTLQMPFRENQCVHIPVPSHTYTEPSIVNQWSSPAIEAHASDAIGEGECIKIKKACFAFKKVCVQLFCFFKSSDFCKLCSTNIFFFVDKNEA